MNNTVNFYITRHGETLFNKIKRMQGWSDSPLSENGIADATKLGKGLSHLSFKKAYASTSPRALDTANYILNESRARPELTADSRLREWGLGSFEGERINVFFPMILKKCQLDENDFFTPQLGEAANAISALDPLGIAENFDAITLRLSAVLEDMVNETLALGGGNVLVVTHGLTIKTLVYLYGRHRIEETALISNASITTIRYRDDQFTLGVINDTSYGKSL